MADPTDDVLPADAPFDPAPTPADRRARAAAPWNAVTPPALAWLEDAAGDLVPLPEETPERGARCPAAHLPIQLVRALMGRAESGKIPLALVYPIEGGYRTVSIGPAGQIKQRVETRVGTFLGGSSISIGVSPPRAPDIDQALADLQRKVKAAGFESAGEMVDVLLGSLSQADRALGAIGATERAGGRRLLVGERVESVQRDLLSLVAWLENAHTAHDEAVARCMKPDPETDAPPDPGLARYHEGKAHGLLAALEEVCTRFPGTALTSLTVPPRGRDLVAELLPKLWTLRLALFRLPDSPEEARGLQAVAEALELLGRDEDAGWCGQCENPPACAACGRRRAAAARSSAPDDGDGAVAFVHEVVLRGEDPA